MRSIREVVSVSLGSSKRNHEAEANLLGEKFRLRRVGVDGDFDKAIRFLKEIDGKVDAIGLGGIDLYFWAGNRKYLVKDADKLRRTVSKTPLVDGSGLKNTLERETVKYLLEEEKFPLKGKKVLMVSAVDRFGMAEALVEAKCKMIFGDLIFGLGIPIPIRSFSAFKILARIILPVVVRLPFKMLYPTGSKQEEKPKPKYTKYYQEADIFAGDFLFIKKYIPDNVKGKWIITNTTTASDVESLKEKGLEGLITTTPVFDGRSFGTNVMEAAFIALIGKPWEEVKPKDYLQLLEKLKFKPRIERLN